MISHNNKCIYIHAPRTAGTSIESAFGAWNSVKSERRLSVGCRVLPNNKCIQHYRIDELIDVGLLNDSQATEYFKFTFVRNPWDRMVSTYMWFMDDTNPGVSNVFDRKASCFDEFVEMFFRYSGSGDVWHRYSQVSYLWTRYGVNFVGRFENLPKDFDIVCDKIGIPRQELLHIGKTEHKPYWEYYTDDSREFILDRYKDDIETFGYEFGE